MMQLLDYVSALKELENQSIWFVPIFQAEGYPLNLLNRRNPSATIALLIQTVESGQRGFYSLPIQEVL
jgi:hypothetical protein